MKRFWILIIAIFSIVTFVIPVKADMIIRARIGNNYYESLEEAILNAGVNDTIYLTSDNNLDETIEISKNVNINLNNHVISANEKVFLVQGGSLNISGKGTIREKEPYYGAIVLIGSDNVSDVDYSTVSVGEDVTLEGWSGIFVDHSNGNQSYGVLVNINGRINALDDKTGDTGIGVYVNGNIKHSDNAPVINLNSSANINSTGFGIYSAGNANYYINGAHIEGIEGGIGMKAGKFKILDGEILGTGPNKTPTSGNNNGINASGTAIQIESNSGYYGNIVLDIRDGLFQSNNSYVIYEYTVNDSPTQIKEINISGGDFISLKDLSVFEMSSSFNGTHTGFITGGIYSSSPSSYLVDGYSTLKNNSNYEVVNKDLSNKMPLIGTGTKNNNFISYSIILSILIFIGMYLYLRIFKMKKV